MFPTKWYIYLLHLHTELTLSNFTYYWVSYDCFGDKRCSAILNLWWKRHSVQLRDGKISSFNLFPPTSKYQVPLAVFGLSSVTMTLPPPSPNLLKNFLQHRSYSISWKECSSCANTRTWWSCSWGTARTGVCRRHLSSASCDVNASADKLKKPSSKQNNLKG